MAAGKLPQLHPVRAYYIQHPEVLDHRLVDQRSPCPVHAFFAVVHIAVDVKLFSERQDAFVLPVDDVGVAAVAGEDGEVGSVTKVCLLGHIGGKKFNPLMPKRYFCTSILFTVFNKQ